MAEYDYDPYGRLIRETGPKAATCPFRCSTKYRDSELDLYCYGHRWYDAAALKWLTPDPIGERGGGATASDAAVVPPALGVFVTLAVKFCLVDRVTSFPRPR